MKNTTDRFVPRPGATSYPFLMPNPDYREPTKEGPHYIPPGSMSKRLWVAISARGLEVIRWSVKPTRRVLGYPALVFGPFQPINPDP